MFRAYEHSADHISNVNGVALNAPKRGAKKFRVIAGASGKANTITI